MKAPFRERFTAYLAKHRKQIYENLGVIVALVAACAALWSGYEAHRTRVDDDRAYVNAVPTNFKFVQEAGQKRRAEVHFNILVVGKTPAYDVEIGTTCTLGNHHPAPPKPVELVRSMLLQETVKWGCIAIAEKEEDFRSTYLHVAGTLSYRDIFRDRHCLPFCFVSDRANDDPEDSSMQNCMPAPKPSGSCPSSATN